MKQKYKIPYTLDTHLGDTALQYTNREGDPIGPEDLTLRPFFIGVFGVMIYICLFISGPLANLFLEGSFLGQALVTIGYIGLIYFALREISVPGLYGYNAVLPFFNYIAEERNRVIRTTYEQPYMPVSQLIGMHEPDNRGILHFNRGDDCAQLFKITGTASHNTFDMDRQQTINEYGMFLRIIPDNTVVTFITNTGGQNVNRQLTHLLDLFDRTTDRLIQSYIGEEVRELYVYVQDNFVTLHQYMLVSAEDTAALDNSVKRIKEFAKQSGMVISSMSIPSKNSNYSLFRSIYAGIQNEQLLTERLNKFNQQYHKKSDLETAASLLPDEKAAKAAKPVPARQQRTQAAASRNQTQPRRRFVTVSRR